MSVEVSEPAPLSRPVWRAPVGLSLFVLLVAAVSAWTFRAGFKDMWNAWGSPEYSHCVLILPVVAFLLWQRKDQLERISFVGSWWGVGLVLLGGLLLFLGQLGTVYTLVEYAYVMTVYGLILAFVGWPAFRVIRVPLLFLLLVVPLPAFFLYNISLDLQLLSSRIGVFFIRMFGISVFLEGNVIDLGGYKLEVAEACSGLRYLFPLMTLGGLMGYFYKGALWKRILVLLSSFPITVLINSLRLGIIGVTVEWWGNRMAEGFLHEIQGWALFMLSAGVMLAELALLHRIGREQLSWRQSFGIDLPASSPAGPPRRMRNVPRTFYVASAMVVTFLAISLTDARPSEIIPSRQSFVQFPMTFGPWNGHRQIMEAKYLDILQLDEYVLADYYGPDQPPVNIYASWYNAQRMGQAVHTPKACLPGGGWEMVVFGQREVEGASVNGQPLRVNRTYIALDDQRQLVYYWFQQRGRIIDNEFAVKWYLLWDAITRHRTDGAMVRLITPVTSDGDLAAADARLTDMVKRLVPSLPRFIPN